MRRIGGRCEHSVFPPNAWRYRDYVIASLNHDTAWARFIREQLAADRFYPDQTELTAALEFIAALIRDMRSRGLFEDTLLIWTTEIGRTPFAQGGDGRDHTGG